MRSIDNFTFTRTSRTVHCPICGKPDWCSIRSDGAIHCMRIASDRPDKGGQGWWHNVSQYGPDLAAVAAQLGPRPPAASAAAGGEDGPELDAGDKDRVYAWLLGHCPLSAAHRTMLERGRIWERGAPSFGSLPADRTDLLHSLALAFPRHVLARVPGLYYRTDGRLRIAAPAGLLVAARDVDGKIRGMQVRADAGDPGKKYVWLSSAVHGGAASGSPAAVVSHPSSQTVWVTEGVKKAVSAAFANGAAAVALPGHGTQADGMAQLGILMLRGALCAVIALDEDSAEGTAALVDKSRDRLIRACLDMGFAVRVARWDPGFAKGIDDLYAAGGQPVVTVATRGPGPGGGGGGGEGCTCWGAKLAGDLTRILRAPIPDTEKIVEMGIKVLCGPGEQPVKHVYMDKLVSACGMTGTRTQQTAEKRAGQAAANLAEWGLVVRDDTDRDKDSGHLRLQFAVNMAQLPTHDVRLPVATRRLVDTARKRACADCGSTLLRVTCMNCGAVQRDPLAAIAESGEPVAVADQPAPARPPIPAIRPEAADSPGGVPLPESGTLVPEAQVPESATLVPEAQVPDSGSRDRGGRSTGAAARCDDMIALARRAHDLWKPRDDRPRPLRPEEQPQ